jgi:predicted deacetylase
MPQSQQQPPLAVITIHDACPAFSTKIFKFTTELEKLGVRYNTALVPFFNEKQDLPRFLGFVDRIESCKGEIVLHGLYHENRRGFCDDFHTTHTTQHNTTHTKAAADKYGRALKYCKRLESNQMYSYHHVGS